MPGSPLKIGPFTGGLNTYSDTTAVGDTEVVELTNFDVDLDGSLVSRPPIVLEKTHTEPLRLLGYYTSITGAQYLIASSLTSTNTLYYFNNTWTVLTSTIAAAAFVQFQNKAWLVAAPTATNPGGSWDPTVGFTAVAAMKKGSAAVIYKERMWVAEGGTAATSSRLYFSNPANLTVWNASDFVDVNAGDGQDIIDIIRYADTVVIFKQNSTYMWSYDSKPSAGQVRPISNSIGIADRDCVFEYENNLYLFHEKNVYTMVNWNYEKLNLKVPLILQNSQPTQIKKPYDLSQVGDRLILRYYDVYYVYGLKTRVWCIWKTTFNLGRFYKVPGSSTSPTSKFLASSIMGNVTGLYGFVEGYDAVRTETIDYSLITKSYDFDSPYQYKKLSWWGADVQAKSLFKATLYPITYGRKITWGEAKLRTWGQAKAFTWARGADISISVESNRNVSGSVNRAFIKFLKATRFRQINFSITGTNTGTTSDGPMRIFAITAFVDAKQKVAQEIN